MNELISSLCLAVFAASAVAQSIDGEIEALKRGEQPKSRAAAQRLIARGAEIVPRLSSELGAAKSGSKAQLRIARLLGRMGPDAKSALPGLITLVKKPKAATVELLAAVDRIAPYAPGLKQDLLEVLADLAFPTEKDYALVLKQRLLEHPDPWTLRLCAILRSARRLELDAEMSMTELLEMLEQGDTIQREVAADLLVIAKGEAAKKLVVLHACFERKAGRRERIEVSFQTKSATSTLVAPLQNRARERAHIARAIVLLAPRKDVPRKVWVALLGVEDDGLLRRAMQILGNARDPEAVDGLVALTKHPDRTIVWEAITTLGMLGPGAKAAVPVLQELGKAEDNATAVRARAALRMVQSDRK